MSFLKKIFGSGSKEQSAVLEQELEQVKKGEFNKIYPILKPGDWVGIKAGALTKTIVGEKENPKVVIGYGYDTPNNFIFLTYQDLEKKPVQEILQESQDNIDNFQSQFEVSKKLEGYVLTASGSDFSSEKILCKAFMLEAHKLLKADEIIVSIPRRRCMMITSKNAPKEILDMFVLLHQDAWVDESYGNAPIANMFFVLRNGEMENIIPLD
jgi:hypothetical protein